MKTFTSNFCPILCRGGVDLTDSRPSYFYPMPTREHFQMHARCALNTVGCEGTDARTHTMRESVHDQRG